MNLEDGIFEQWVEEAKEEVAEKGWRNATVNALILLCHDMSSRRDRLIYRALKGPARWFVGIAASGLLWLVIRDVLNL